jgi:hypothetical protein
MFKDWMMMLGQLSNILTPIIEMEIQLSMKLCNLRTAEMFTRSNERSQSRSYRQGNLLMNYQRSDALASLICSTRSNFSVNKIP